MNTIFLSIDGVLNNQKFLENRKELISKFDIDTKDELINIDLNKVVMIKELVNKTNSNIIIIDKDFSDAAINRLIEVGLPIIAKVTTDVKSYIYNNNITNYVIISNTSIADDKLVIPDPIEGLSIKNLMEIMDILEE